MTESPLSSCLRAGLTPSELHSASSLKNRPLVCIGIDPGFTGAIASYDSITDQMYVTDMPVTKTQTKTKTKSGNYRIRTDLDITRFCEIIDDIVLDVGNSVSVHVTIEKAQPMGASKNGRTQGVSSTARYMEAYGMVIGSLVALNVPYTTISAAKWKRDMGVSADKDLALAQARRLFPQLVIDLSRKKDHGRAEAALICYYGIQLRGEVNAGG